MSVRWRRRGRMKNLEDAGQRVHDLVRLNMVVDEDLPAVVGDVLDLSDHVRRRRRRLLGALGEG